MLNYHPIPIVSWEFIEPGTIVRDCIAQPQQFVRVLFENGQVLLAKRHPTARHRCGGHGKLFGAEDESLCFFSLSSNGFNQIKPIWNAAMANNRPNMHSAYPVLRDFIDDTRVGGLRCHIAMYEIWHGPRDPKCQLHHLNRDKFDWCENNLIELDIQAHRNADARQKLVESAVGDLHLLTHARLRELTLMPNNTFLHELQSLRQQYGN